MTSLDPDPVSVASDAVRVVHPGPPLMRVRYRDGVQLLPYGVPNWIPYARLLVEIPPPPRDLAWNEARLLGVQTANELGRRSGDPLWTDEPGTPTGWTWAWLALTRQLALVPIELYGSFRHRGGVSTNRLNWNDKVRQLEGEVPEHRASAQLSEDLLVRIENYVGAPLPIEYRNYLARSNGGRPMFPSVYPARGFIVDQPLFGVTIPGEDLMTDVRHQYAYHRDRLTPQWLPIGFVQGGLLVLKLTGDSTGSVWYLDDDIPREPPALTAEQICRSLLTYLEPTFNWFWANLRPVPAEVNDLAAKHAEEGWARILSHPELGRSLPENRRAPSRD
jgi:hypothetical protein